MKALILAAGRGSRMKDMTDDRPKCLVKMRGRSLLEWQLSALRGAGIEEVGIITGYRRELLDGRGLVEFHNPRWEQTNMVSSLEYAAEWLGAQPCIVSYSDIFFDASAVTSLMASEADLAVTFDPHWLVQWQKRFADPLSDAETFRLRPDGSLAEVGNKPRTVEEVEGQYMGLLRFSPAGWAEVQRLREAMEPTVRDRMHMTGTLQKVIEAGKVPVQAVRYAGEWGEVDTQDDLKALSQ